MVAVAHASLIKVGNVIAVRVCARYSGWVNNALQGSLYVKILNEGIAATVFLLIAD